MTAMKVQPRIKGIILVVTGSMLWGVSGTAAQYLFQNKGFSPEWLVVIRLLVSGVILLSYAYIKDKKNIWEIWNTKHNCFTIICFSIIGMLGVQYTYFITIKYGNAATATILQYLSPVMITCYLAIRNRKLPGFMEIIAISLAMAGTFLIITKGDIHSIAISKLVLFWGIISAVAATFYTLQPVALLSRWGSILVTGWAMVVGGIAFSFVNPPWKIVGEWSVSSIFAVLFVVLFGTLIAFLCYMDSLKFISPTEASVLSSFEPLSAAFLSVLWLNVSFSLWEWVGLICIIITAIILSLVKK